MAKSSSFFGLRRGSTKSLTFSVLNGKQITKDRVTSVRNPKSNGQIMQRMKMSAVNVIYRYFKTLITRGQQGIAYGEKSRLAWLSQVLAASPLYNAKGSNVLLPWTFPLTKGSLQTLGADYLGNVATIHFPTTYNAENVTDAQLIAANDFLQEGDQIAVVLMKREGTLGYSLVQGKHTLNGETTLYADMLSQGITVSDDTRGEAPEDEGEEDTRYNILTFTPSTGYINGAVAILSRLNGSVYERSTETFEGNPTMFSQSYINICADSYRDAAQRTNDWPEIIEEGFIPLGYSGAISNNETIGTDETTNVRLLYVYGFLNNTYKRVFVTEDGTVSGTPYGYPNIDRKQGALSQWSDTDDENYTAADAGVSISEFNTIYG